MALFEGLLGGGGGSPLDLYGDLFTPEQKAALQNRELSQGLFRMAEKLGQAAQPSRVPVSTLGALGSALGAFGTGSDMTEQALKGMQVAEQVRESQRKRAALNSYQAIIEQALRATGVDPKSPQGQQIVQQTLANQGTPAAPGAPTGGPLANNAPPPPPPGGLPPDIGNIAGLPPTMGLPGPGKSAFGMPDVPSVPPAVTAIPGFEPLPGGGFRAIPAGAPQQQTGLLPPPPGANPQMGQGGGLLAGLPFDQTAPGAGGVDLSNIRIEPLSGEAAPAGVDLPFPTRANPNKPKSAWEQGYTYDQPKVPFGQDPGDRVPTPADPRGMTPVIQAAAQRYGVDPNVALRVADKEGLRQFYGDGGKSGTAFQLYTGGGLGNEFQKETGLNPLDPKNEPAAIDWAMRNVSRTGWGPYHGAAQAGVGARTGLPGQDTVIPSGPRLQRSDLQNVADTGGGPLATPPGAGAALATPSGGVIPGINMTPTQLGLLNALGKIGGLDSPFSSLLETYYKSPSYLTEAAGASTRGQLGAEIELKPKLEAAIAWAKIDPNLNEYERKAQVDRYSDLLKQMTTAKTTSKEVVVAVPGLPPERRTLNNEQVTRLNLGEGLPELGFPPGTRLSEPYLTPEQTAAQTARGQASVNVDPNAFNITPDPRMLPKGPGTTEPAPLGNGVTLPPVNQASPIVGSGDYLKARQKDWSDTENEWSKGIASSHLAEQRMQAIMTAMKSYQTGAYANELSDLRAKLKVVGVALPDSIAGNPALAQEILKNNFAASVETMKSSGLSRWTQAELFAAQKNISQPNLQPEANLEIGAQSIGALRWERAMKDAWAEAKKYGWRDPQDFQSSFARANPVQNFVDQARQEIGPLKGMAQPPSTGTTPQPPAGGVRERRYNPATGKLE